MRWARVVSVILHVGNEPGDHSKWIADCPYRKNLVLEFQG